MMLSPIYQPRRRNFSYHAFSAPELGSSPSLNSPMPRRFAWQAVEGNADASATWFILCLPEPSSLGLETGKSLRCGVLSASLYMDALQANVSIGRHFSQIFPPFPRSLASVLFPRPAASPFCFCCAALRVWVSKQISPAQQARGCGPKHGRDFSSEPPQKARLRPWERGTLPPRHTQIVCRGPRALASLRARVSRGQSGQIQ
jgi:hypothetical protein